MKKNILLVGGLLLALISLCANSVWASQYKSFKDWNVACSVGLVCSMEISPQTSDVNLLGFKRGTAASAPLEMILMFEGDLVEGSQIIIEIPGQSVKFELPARSGSYDAYQSPFPMAIDQEKLILALKAAANIEIFAVGVNKKIHEKLSLSGVVDSMLFIDETQGRAGKRDALHAKGEGLAEAVETRVVELTSQQQLPGKVMQVWKDYFSECGDETEDIIAKYGAFRVDLNKESALFLLPCGFAGAYNLPYIAVVQEQESGNARIAAFPVIGNLGPTIISTAYNINWNDKKSQLDAFFKGRGIGDCGSKHLWQWNGEGAFGKFELVEERMKDDCDEKIDEFPLIWPPD